MSRARTLLSVVLPSLVAGGVLFGSAFSEADPRPRPRPAPSPSPAPEAPESPTAPMPPMPPMPPNIHHSGGGISVNIHDGKVEVSGIEEMVADQLAAVHDMLDSNPDIPPEVRAKLKDRMSRVRGVLKSRLGALKSGDVSQIEPQMQAMSAEINAALAGLEGDLAGMNDKLGEKLQRQLEKQFAKGWKGFSPGNVSVHFGGNPHDAHARSGSSDDDGDNDSDSDDSDVPDVAVDSPDDSAAQSLRGMALRPDQRATLAKLRMDSEQMVKAARNDLDEKSRLLQRAIEDANTPDAELERQIEDVSRIEAKIRTARVVAWHRARRMLDDGQRARVEAAVKKHH